MPRYPAMVVPLEVSGERAHLLIVVPPKGPVFVDECEVKASSSSLESVRAAARLLYGGEWGEAGCMSTSGRLDAHGTYVYSVEHPHQTVCTFCHKSI